MKKIIIFLVSILSVLILSACAAKTLIEKRNLDVQTKMSDSVFLEPVSPNEQIVYIKVRNTTDKDINLDEIIKKTVQNKGFIITNDPKKAYFMIQVNLLQIGKSNKSDAKNALNSTFGGAILAGGIISMSGGSVNSTNKLALIGATVGFLGDVLVKDVYFTMITDVEIRQRPLIGETIEQNARLNLSQGVSANETQTIKSQNVQWKKYRTRIVSVANKANLEFEESKQGLINGLTQSISGIL